jgi:hypothetical protein
MKHVCVAARIGDGEALDAGNSRSIAKSSNAASRGGRSRFQAYFAWMRPRSATLGAPIPRDSRAPARSHPRKRARRRAEEGPLWGSDPADARGSAITRHDQLHGRIPASGAPAPRCADPCSTFRCAADSGSNPLGLARVLAHGIVASHLLRMTKPRVLLRALSQNRASASRVSFCYGL